MRVTFADCEVDFGTREAFRRGRLVHLSPKAFALLELLVTLRPDAVPKTAIHEKLWPASFVSEATLASLVAELRAALGQKVIRTIHGFGYAFAEESSREFRLPPESGAWRLRSGDSEIELLNGENALGRDPRAEIAIDSKGVSRRHAVIVIDGERATLRDLGSKNGTYLNATRVADTAPLADGDNIRLGGVTLALRQVAGPASTITEGSTKASVVRRPRRDKPEIR